MAAVLDPRDPVLKLSGYNPARLADLKKLMLEPLDDLMAEWHERHSANSTGTIPSHTHASTSVDGPAMQQQVQE